MAGLMLYALLILLSTVRDARTSGPIVASKP